MYSTSNRLSAIIVACVNCKTFEKIVLFGSALRESMYSCNLAPKWHHCQKIVKKWHQAVKLHFFNLNSTFDVPDWFNRSISRSPVNFKKIGEGHILPYHVTWSHRLKIAIFKTCSESLNMGRVCSVLMPVVTLQSFKMIGRLEVR